MIINSKPKHDSRKLHLYLANYVIKEDVYHDVDLRNFAEFIFECSSRYKYKYNEFCIEVKCEINNKLFTTQKETFCKLSNITHVVNGVERKDFESDKLLKMLCWKIYDRICSVLRNNIYSTDGLQVKNLSISLIADYNKMTLNHYIQQPRSVLESQLAKHIRSTSNFKRGRYFYFLARRYELL